MQNLLAALNIPTLVAEVASTASCVERSYGSFADTFVDTRLESEPQSVDPAELGFVVPMSCPAVVAPRAVYCTHPGANLEEALSADVGSSASANFVVSLPVYDSCQPASVLDVLAGQVPPENASEQTGDDESISLCTSASSLKFGAHARQAALIEMPNIAPDRPDREATSSLTSLKLSVPTILATDVDPSSVQGSDTETLFIDIADGAEAAAFSSGSPDLVDGTDAPHSELCGPQLEVGQPASLAQGTNGPSGAVDRPVQPIQGKSANGNRAQLQAPDQVQHLPPMWQAALTGEFVVDERTDEQSVGASVLDVELELPFHNKPEALQILASSKRQDLESISRDVISSFWERLLCGTSVPADARTQATEPNDLQSKPALSARSLLLSIPPQTLKSAVLNQSSSDFTHLVTPKRSGTQTVDGISKPVDRTSASVEDIILSDLRICTWDESKAPLEVVADVSLPQGPAASSRAPTGLIMSPSALAALPVPHVAAQLSEVLVSNPGTVTELALAPEELGHVRLRMEADPVNPDRMIVLINVERPETLELFRRHSSELADAIRSAGYAGADIGFGQSGREGSSDQRAPAPSPGTSLPFDEIMQFEPSRMMTVGASLDLRL